MKKKHVAGLLALFFGLWGVHRFYLGQRLWGILHFAMAMFGLFLAIEEGAAFIALPAIIGFVDAVLFFAMPRADFDRKYNKTVQHSHQRASFDRHREIAAREADYQQPYSSVHRNDYHYERLKKSGIRHFRQRHYDAAADDFEDALEIVPDSPSLHFNLACTYALLREAALAFHHLEEAVKYGFTPIEKIHTHDALAYLRALPQFKTFVEHDYRMPPAQLSAPKEDELHLETPAESQSTPNILDQIIELGKLRDKGILTDEEFAHQKQKLLEQ
jgi:TM2 domain-containing membrane protein YozV